MVRIPGEPNVRNDAPASDDYGRVTRPIFSSPVPVAPASSTASTLSEVAADVAPVTLLATNTSRLGFSIKNTSATATLFVKASASGGAVSTTFYTVSLPPGAYYEDPFHYVGVVTGVWSAAVGSALVTEYT